jgi:hypothetical protein
MKKSIGSYLGNGRLADVLALLQVLSYSPKTRRTHNGLMEELQRDPLSATTWTMLAEQHPEFFRVRHRSSNPDHVSLIARVVQEVEEREDGDEMHPILSPDVANKLMELAIELHDRQLGRRDRWKTVTIPICGALIAAAAAITAAVISTSSHKASSCEVAPLGHVVQSASQHMLVQEQ